MSSALSELALGEITFDTAFERVKAHGTELLRGALIDAYEEVVTLEGEVADLREQVRSLKSDLDTANDEIAHLSAESAT